MITPVVIVQLVGVVILSALVGLCLHLFWQRIKPTEQELAAAERRREARARRHEEWCRAIEASRAAEAAARAERRAERLAANPPTLRGGLIKAGLILCGIGVIASVLLGVGLVETFLFACGIVVLVIGACLPETSVKASTQRAAGEH